MQIFLKNIKEYFAVLLLSFLCVGCNPFENFMKDLDRVNPLDSKSINYVNGNSYVLNDGVYYILRMGKYNYSIGETINIEYLVTNINKDSVYLDIRKSPALHVEIKKNDTLVYEMPLTAMDEILSHYLESGETEIFTTTWDQLDQGAVQVSSGTYEIISYLHSPFEVRVSSHVNILQ